MSILFYCDGDHDNSFLTAFQQHLPKHTINVWPQCPDKFAITTAIVWKPPVDFFDGLDSLQHVLSIAAGVDHLLDHPGLPDNVNVVRLADAGMAQLMAQYVLYGVLHAHRKMHELRNAQYSAHWVESFSIASAEQFRVGILGAGELGSVVAQRLMQNDYPVSCWSRTPKDFPGVQHHTDLDELLPTVNALVCLLPLTPQTKHILNASLFAKLQQGAFIINPGRGDHLAEDDLIPALDSGHIGGALLDVFCTEPLPQSHPFWQHKKIIITPHIAAQTPSNHAVQQITHSIALLEQGKKPRGLVDRQRGY
jgi:glyoxylate/hydroxypyruvate reductase A